MTNSQRLAAVRLRLEQWLQERSCAESNDPDSEKSPRIYGESILIRDGFYCGRQFNAGAYRAVWFMEEDELKISDRDGKWVCSLRGEELVPESLQPIESVPTVTAADEVEGRDIIPMPHSMSDSEAKLSAKSNDEEDSGEQEIRRAA